MYPTESEIVEERSACVPKWLKKSVDITTTVLLILFVIFVVLLVGVRIFGLEPHIVLSGSMEPEIKTGSLVYLVDVSPEEAQNLKPGDTVTFLAGSDGTKVTHRIYNVVGPIPIYELDDHGNPKRDANGDPIIQSYATDKNGQTIVMYTTYGINNNDTLDGDPEKGNLASSNVVGRPVFSIPLLGYIANYVQTPSGRIMAFGGCFLLVLITFFSGMLGKSDKKEKGGEVAATADGEAEPTEPENKDDPENGEKKS